MDSYPGGAASGYFVHLKEADVHFDQQDGSIVARIHYFVRIKILSEEGRPASVINLPYFSGDGLEEISRIQGRTIKPDGTVIALDSSDVRNVNVGTGYYFKEFSMPEPDPGAILEYRYTLHRRFLQQLPDFYVAHRGPTAKARINLYYPDYLRYEMKPSQIPVRIDIERQEIDTSSVPKVFTFKRPEPLTIHSWTVHDVPAIQQKPMMNNIDQYRGKMMFLLSEFGKPRQTLENSWELVAARLRHQYKWFRKIEEDKSLDTLINRIKNRAADDQLRLQDSLFSYLNREMVHNGSGGTVPTVPPKDVLEGTSAGQASINYTLLLLLRRAGIEAWPVLVASRNSSGLQRNMPTRFQFNGFLVMSRINGRKYWMDGSYAKGRPNLLPVAYLAQQAFVLKERSFEWLKPEPPKSKFWLSVDVEAELELSGQLSGRIEASQYGYPARQIRIWLSQGEKQEQIVKKSLLDGYTDVTVSGTEISFSQDSVYLAADFTIPDYGNSFQSGVEFRPMVVGYRLENPLRDEPRSIPVVLDSP